MVAYALLGIGSLFEGFIEGQKAKAEIMRWRMMNEYYRMVMTKAGWDVNTHSFHGGFGDQGLLRWGMQHYHSPLFGDQGGGTGGAGAAGGNQFLNAVMKYESASGTALISRVDTDSHGLTLAQGGNPDEISQGLFHIQNHPGGTWTQALKNIGLSIKDYPTPRGAPPDIQIKAASTIPYSAWGKQTREEIARDLNIPVNFSGKFGDLVNRYGGASAADQPSKAATPEAMMVPSGGQFALPGVTQPAAFSSESDPRAPVDARPIDDSPFNEPSIAAKARGLTPQHPFYRPEDSMRYGDEGAGSVVQDTGAPYGGHSTNIGRPPFHSPPPPPSIPIGGGAGNVLEASTERGPELAGSEIHQEHPGPDAYRDVLSTGSKGREGKGKETDKPAKKVTPTAAEKKTGIPKGPTIDSQQRPYEMASVPGQHAVGIGRSPLTYDPYWRPNPPTAERKGPTKPNTGLPTPPQSVKPAVTTPPAATTPDQFKTGGPELAAATAGHPVDVGARKPEMLTSVGGGPDERLAAAPPSAGPSTAGGGGGPSLADMQNQLAMMERMGGDSGGGGGGSNPALSMPDDRLRPPMDVQIPQMVASNELMAAQPGGGSSYGQVAQAPVNIPTWQRDQDAGDIIASRKGGPIQKFNRGGIPRKPVWRAQTGGVAPSSMTGLQYMMQPLSSYVGPLPNGGWSGTPYSQLAPNQQQWANTTQNLMAQETAAGRQDAAYWSGGGRNPAGIADTSQFYNQYTAMPAAIWPTTNTPSVPVSTAPNTTATSTATDPYLTNITAQNAAQQVKTTNDLAAQTASASSAATTANAPTVIKNPNPQATTPTTPASSTPAGTNYTGATGTPTKGATGSNSASQGDIATTAQKTTSPLAQAYSGFAKGGGIPRRPVLRLQGGGGAAYGNNTASWSPAVTPTPYTTFQPAAGQPLPTVQPPLMGSASPPTPGSANATTYAGYQPWGTGLQWLASQPTSQYTNPMMFTGQQINADLQALPAGQQQWYNEQMANKMAQGTGQWYYNPASLPTAPAATTSATTTPAATTAAPANKTTTSTATDPYLQSIEAQNATTQATLTNDLANQTATGTAAANTANAPTVSKTTTPQATTPTTPPSSTPSATNYSGQPTSKTTGNYGSNYATQGDIATTTQKTTSPLANAYTGFDDGGDVGPSVVGPPPALGSAMGQQTQIPPYYYNPYTYAPSAAPVGKGVSTTSVGTVMPSAAVPTYADGGDVSTMDSQQGGFDPVLYNQGMPQDGGYPGAVGPYFGNVQPNMGGGAGMGITSRGGISMRGMGGGQRGFAGLDIPMPPEFGPGGEFEKPEGAPQYASSIMDHNGNPSPDIIHAIQDGVGSLMKMFGLQAGGNQGMPTQQQTQGQQAFRDARSGITPQQMETYHNIIDPEHQLDYGMRYLAGLGTIYKYYMMQGETDTAGRVAAGMLLYSRELAQNYGEQALQHWYKGDEQGAAELEAMGFTAIPNGVKYDVKGQPNSDGTRTIGAFGLTNQKLWEQHVAPMMIVAGAMGLRDGVAVWRALQSVAEKYDPQERLELAQTLRHEQDTEAASGAEPYIQGIQGGLRQGAPTTDSQGGQSGLPIRGAGVTWPSVQSTPASTRPQVPPASVVPRALPVTTPPQPGTLAAPPPQAPAPSNLQTSLPPPNQMAGDINPAEALPTTQGAPPAGAGQGAAQTPAPPPGAEARGGIAGRTSPAYQFMAGQQDVTPEQETDYYSRTREIAHGLNFTQQNDPIIGGQPVYRPNEPDWVRVPKQYLPQVRQAYNDQMRIYQQALSEASQNEQRMYESHHADLAAQIGTQRQRYSQAQTDYRQLQTQRYGAVKQAQADYNKRKYDEAKEQDPLPPNYMIEGVKPDGTATKTSPYEAAREAVPNAFVVADPNNPQQNQAIEFQKLFPKVEDQQKIYNAAANIFQYSRGAIPIDMAADLVRLYVDPTVKSSFRNFAGPRDSASYSDKRVEVKLTDDRGEERTFTISPTVFGGITSVRELQRQAKTPATQTPVRIHTPTPTTGLPKQNSQLPGPQAKQLPLPFHVQPSFKLGPNGQIVPIAPEDVDPGPIAPRTAPQAPPPREPPQWKIDPSSGQIVPVQ